MLSNNQKCAHKRRLQSGEVGCLVRTFFGQGDDYLCFVRTFFYESSLIAAANIFAKVYLWQWLFKTQYRLFVANDNNPILQLLVICTI